MNRLFLMCGISFSGKSTLARELAGEIGALIISLDAINHGRGLGMDGQAVSDEEWLKTHALALEQLESGMTTGQDIIIDDTNCYRWLRDRFRIKANSRGYATYVVYTRIPVEQAMQRLIDNETVKSRPGLPREYFSIHVKSFEPPTSEEGCLIFEIGSDSKDWMERMKIR